MTVLAVITVLAIGAACIAKGWVVALIPLGLIFFWLIGRDKTGATIDSFFAFCFFSGIFAVLYEIGRSIV